MDLCEWHVCCYFRKCIGVSVSFPSPSPKNNSALRILTLEKVAILSTLTPTITGSNPSIGVVFYPSGLQIGGLSDDLECCREAGFGRKWEVLLLRLLPNTPLKHTGHANPFTTFQRVSLYILGGLLSGCS